MRKSSRTRKKSKLLLCANYTKKRVMTSPGGELIPLGYFFTSAGLTDEHCYFFLARPVQTADVHKREEGEAILECRAVTTSELSRMIAQNEIRDSNTLGICARLAAGCFISLGAR